MRFLLLLAVFVPSLSFADSSNYWQCSTVDVAKKMWTAQSKYQKIAINSAFNVCKKQSQYPKTCKASQNNCEHFVHGINVSPAWRCAALDGKAVSWKSNLYKYKYDAAMAAKDYCKSRSEVPESCYVNMVGCVNLNAGN